MNQDDQAFEALVRELGRATPEIGFEQRVLRDVERRRLELPERPRPRAASPFGLAFALGVVVVSVSIGWYRSHSSTSHRNVAQIVPQAQEAYRSPPSVWQAAARSVPVEIPRSRNLASVDPSKIASFPAPPAPLTEQERLLLQLARASDPVQVAMLTPDELALEEARNREEFQRFFPPPDPAPNDVPPDNTLLEAVQRVAEAQAGGPAAKQETDETTQQGKQEKGEVR
jgi:hypothetical protein